MLFLTEGLAAQAQSQFGLLTVGQVDAQLPRWQLRRLAGAGVLVPVRRGVYRAAGVPVSWRQRALAACLALGEPVAISHRAAACLWGVPDLARPGIEVTVPAPRHPRANGLTAHRSALPASDVTRRWGIPVTTPARTIIELSAVLGVLLLQRVADSLLRHRQLTAAELSRRFDANDPPLRRNRAAMEAVLLRREHGVGDSPPEDWVADTLVAAGLPEPVRHYQVELGGRIRILDHAYPQWRIGMDYDGWTVHHDLSHFHGDRERQADFQLAGWLLLQITAVWSARMLVDRVSEAIALRQGQQWRPSPRPATPPR